METQSNIYPIGPFRNSGDLRVWIVLVSLWLIGAGIYVYMNPAEVRANVADLSDYQPCASTANEHDKSMCAYQIEDAAEQKDKDLRNLEMIAEVGILPPVGLSAGLWALLALIGWVREGYRA
jgi:hypothetical protein